MSGGFISVREGVAASIFLAIYTIYLGLTGLIVYREGWRTTYTFLLVFGIFRVSGQLCGVVFSKLGIEHWQWLIAYLVLTAEGYFTLVLTSFHFLANAQVTVHGTSWLRPTKKEIHAAHAGESKMQIKCAEMNTFAFVFHWLLIPANALVISGGTMLTGVDADKWSQEGKKIATSKALRCSGQATFLAETIVLVAFAIYVYKSERVRNYTMKALFFAFPFLLVRGIFGILSIFLDRMNYFKISNYDENGLSAYFIACEYTMATTMEFISACTLISVYYHDRYYGKFSNKERIIEPLTEEESDSKGV
ncbi:hypothetical protein CLIB1423_02S10066 [[Candida] railenensis]|uniref:Uncharacterized protein n=1 Tax=[Candida] railenensis TaxID=45579 RepID=A0A9P0VX29_9ASCO|nr:hypothetical protein CLIB1423_02S10066 [[Candida] railenensis]